MKTSDNVTIVEFTVKSQENLVYKSNTESAVNFEGEKEKRRKAYRG